MGIYIYEDIIPERIGKKEWEAVYEESLKLLQEGPFLDKIIRDTGHGNRYACAVHSGERHDLFGGKTGWRSLGDMITGGNTEDIKLFRDLDSYDADVPDNGADVLTCRIYADDYPEIKTVNPKSVRIVFGDKTQGEESHL